MEINIKPDDIDKYVKDAILASTIGNKVKEAIETAVKNLFEGYKNPIHEMVRCHVSDLIHAYLDQPDVREKILISIAKTITPQNVDLIIEHGIKKLNQYIEDSR